MAIMCCPTRRIQACILALLLCFITRSSLALNALEFSCQSNCHCSSDTFECRGIEFSSIVIPKNVSTLKLTRVPIYELTTKSIESSERLSNLVFNYDGIIHIDFDFFENFNQIKILNLADNQIKALDSEIFKPLASLKKIVFKSNHIKKLHENLFYKLARLELMDFSDNQIVTPISRCMFRDLMELRYLDLSGNQIQVIDSDVFEKNDYLQYVNISNNKLVDVKTLFEDLTYLSELDLSHNQIRMLDKDVFEDCSSLKRLFLNNNQMEYLPLLVFQYLENLVELKLDNNPLKHLPTDIFHQNRRIQSLDISNLKIFNLRYELLQDLADLKSIDISNNIFLQNIDDGIFLNKPELSSINLASTNLSRVPVSLLSLDKLKNFSLENVRIHCDCHSVWFTKLWQKIRKLNLKYTNFECKEANGKNIIEFLETLRCDIPEVIYNSPITYYMLLTPAMLDCVAIGNPDPAITWFTPNGITLHDSKFNATDHPRVHNNQLVAQDIKSMKVMANGSLYIDRVTREDAGNYTCFALNKNGNVSGVIVVRLDPDTFNKRQFMSFAVGIFCAVIFLAGTICVHAVIFVCKKICSKSKGESPKTDIHQMIEAAEQYRSQQLEKLRETYMAQVKKIEEDCAQQTKWIWESYHGQVKDSKDTKDNGASHLSSIKEQYNDQVKKVRDYTTSQLNKVRENYVFQRDKIRKFSAHQVLRFRENCKYQQQALNKVFENFNIDNCKNGCGQSTSEINFSSDRDMTDNAAAGDHQVADSSLPIDKLLSSCNDGGIKLGEKKCPILKCQELGSSFSIYYTPTETTNSPVTPRTLNRNDGSPKVCRHSGEKFPPLLVQTDDTPSLQIELTTRCNSVTPVHLLDASLDLDQNNLDLEPNQRVFDTDRIQDTIDTDLSETIPATVFKLAEKNPNEDPSA